MSGEKQTGPDDDHDLVLRCKKGQLDAFEALVIKHQKKMLNVAFRMIGNYEDSCEVVQDAFLAAYNGIQRFEGRSRFSTWLCTIVINTSRNRLQQIKSASRHEKFSLDEPLLRDDGSVRIELASDCPSAPEKLERKETQAAIQGCIDLLEDDFKEVLILRDIRGYTYEEISDMTKIAQGTVKSRLFRARESMRKCLRKALGD